MGPESVAALQGERGFELRTVLDPDDVPSRLREEAGQSLGLDPGDDAVEALPVQIDDQCDVAETLEGRVGDRLPDVALVEFCIADGRDETSGRAGAVMRIDEAPGGRGEEGCHGAESDRTR